MKMSAHNPSEAAMQKQVEEALRKAHAQTELVLSSIPSILIGVDQKGIVTHWNAVAETTFGIPGKDALNRPFSQCAIPWDFETVEEAIQNCRSKGSSVRLDNVRYQRLNGQEGFLGFTIIPIRSGGEGPIECILFGADITERKRTEELKNEFVSTVSHELRSPLTVIKEGVSQILEGILGEINEDQRRFLSISLEGINRLGRIVDDLLDVSRIETGKLQLKREHVNVVDLVNEVAATFEPRAKEKGLAIETHFLTESIEAYLDRDRLVQVFMNLVDNALKFTERGRIEISVADKGQTIECTVSDTGAGISEADLPRVFGKFQQFGRSTATSGEKGTGLGLAICKGIVEAHQGRIWVESKFGAGTKFIFSLPKFSAKELFRDSIVKGLDEAMREETNLSIVVFNIENYDSLEQRMGRQQTATLVRGLEGAARGHLRRKFDVAVRDTRAILVLLPATGREEALMTAGRIQQTFDDYLSEEGLQNEIRFHCKVATFPEDGNTEDELLNKVWGG